jgi:hypothetical protein
MDLLASQCKVDFEVLCVQIVIEEKMTSSGKDSMPVTLKSVKYK